MNMQGTQTTTPTSAPRPTTETAPSIVQLDKVEKEMTDKRIELDELKKELTEKSERIGDREKIESDHESARSKREGLHAKHERHHGELDALTKQYAEMIKTEGVTLAFPADGIEALAHYAFEVNQTTQNIGARRLYTIMERLLEELSFEAPDMGLGRVTVNAAYVTERLSDVVENEDLSKYIL